MTAFRTISMRIRGYDEETEEYIGNVEELTGKIADLTKTAKTPGGISLFTDETKTTYKSTYQLLKEISEIYSDLTDKQQAALLETLAGKRGGQVLAGILSPENFAEVERAMKEMSTAAGAAADEMGIVEQSLSYKLNSFRETWVGVWQSLIDRGTVGGVIDFLTDVSEGLDKIINTVGGGSALGMALEGVMMTQGFGFLQYNKDTGKMGGMLLSLWNVLTNKGTVNQSTSQFIKAFEMNAMNNLDAEAIDKLATSIGGVDKAVVDSAKGFAQSGKSIEQWKTQAMSAAGAGNALKGVLMSIFSIAGSMAIAWGISELVEGANAFINAQDHMISAAKGYESSIKTISSSMDSYKSQVSSLSDTMKSDDATTEQKVQARKDLISLQQKLIEEYGKEPGAISDINAIINTATSTMDGYSSAIDKTSEAWNRLAKAAMDSAKRSSDAQDSFWKKFANKALYGTESSVQASLDQYKKYSNEISPAGIFKTNIGQSKELEQYIQALGGINSPNGWSFNGSATEVLHKYEQLYAKAIALGNVNDEWTSNLQAKISDIKNLIDETAEYRNFYAEDLINYTQEYAQARESINGLYDEYNNAIAENQIDLASNLREQIVSQLSEVEQLATKNPNVKDWFANTFAEFQQDIDFSEFANHLNDQIVTTITDDKGISQDITTSYQEIFDNALKNLEHDGRRGTRAMTLEELQHMGSLYDSEDLTQDKGYTQKQIQTFKDLASAAVDAGYDIQTVLTMLNKLGQIDTRNLQDAEKRFIPRNASEEYRKEMTNYLKSLEESGQLEQAITLDIDYDQSEKEIRNQLDELQKGGNVNLQLRPEIETSELNEAGFNAGEGFATVFSHTFSNEAGNVAVNFTPIMIDPKTGRYLGVMEADEFDEYCQNVVDGVRKDDLNLQIGGEFKGDDAIKQATKTANKIHELHKQLSEVQNRGVEGDIEAIQKALDIAIEDAKAFTIDFDMTSFLHGLDAVQTALTSTEGLTDDVIQELKNYFSELDDFNPAELFEETTRGIQVNHQELARLVKEMESVSYDQIVQQEKEVIEKYDSLMEAMSRMNKTSSEYADAQIQLDELREQSKLIGTLISQYDAATSAYKKFLNAQATPDQSAGYVAIASQYEEMKKLADANRWGNDDLKAYLNIFSYEDTTSEGIEKQQELWKSLKETIDGTNKTKMDFFKLDKDGNVTIQGAANLADAIKQKFGDAYATLEDGMWTLDLTGGKFEEVAKGLNISESALDLILDSLGEFGYDVQRNINLAVDAVTRLGVTTEEAKQKFQDLGYDFNFDENEASISQLNGYIKTLEIFANKNRTENGAFDMHTDGMKEAVVLLDELIRKRQQLEDQNMDVMNVVDTSKMESGLQRAIELIQQIRINAEQIELGKANGALDIDIQQYRTKIINALSELGKEDLSQYVEKFDLSELFDINQGNVDSKIGEIKDKLSSITTDDMGAEPIKVEATADTESISSDVDAAVSENEGKEITVGTTVDSSEVESFKTTVSSSEVSMPVKPIIKYDALANIRGSIQSLDVSVPVKINPVGGTIGSEGGSNKKGWNGSGYAGAYGGAFAGGRALVGELGRELVVDPHNGRYQTVGDHGAEFVNLPKDAIVFNHWQTKRLFQGGNPGRGTAFAEGNAYGDGNLQIYEKDRAVAFRFSPDYDDKAVKAMQKDLIKTAQIAGDAMNEAFEKVGDNKDVMSTLSGQLDEIQSAYNSLKDIMDTYNETGSITIDQAQELMQTDFRYLALLSDENGVLGLNEAGFESLAQAKLQEMQITMIRNAIDTVNSLTSEAAAADYLSNSYLNLGQSALSASQMTLQAAVNAAHARGAMQGAAADMIAQGVNNAMTLMQNVGLNSGQKPEGGGGGGGAEDAAGAEGETEEQSVEKELDWIERLLERLTKLTKKWTDQAERFFSYWNKNWAINKALKANRDEINANKKAYRYYMTKAGEVELDAEYARLVQKGDYLVETITDQELSDKIDAYQQW